MTDRETWYPNGDCSRCYQLLTDQNTALECSPIYLNRLFLLLFMLHLLLFMLHLLQFMLHLLLFMLHLFYSCNTCYFSFYTSSSNSYPTLITI